MTELYRWRSLSGNRYKKRALAGFGPVRAKAVEQAGPSSLDWGSVSVVPLYNMINVHGRIGILNLKLATTWS